MQLSITDLEAERKRREFARIEHTARVGGALPKPEFRDATRHIDVNFGPVQIVLRSEIGEEIITRKTTVHISKRQLEKKLFELFPDKDVTKKLYDHILVALEKHIAEEPNAKLKGDGDTKFCG